MIDGRDLTFSNRNNGTQLCLLKLKAYVYMVSGIWKDLLEIYENNIPKSSLKEDRAYNLIVFLFV